MTYPSWRHRAAAPLVALLGFAGVGAAYVVSTASTASAVTPVTTESEFRDAWANDSDVVLGADITLICLEQSDPGASEAVRDLAEAGTLDGQGHTITQTCPETRVLQITGETGQMTLSNVTITGGQAVHDTFSGNGGGGIQSTVESTLIVDNSNISGNATCEGGGGIEMDASGDLFITNSTFVNNIADAGGGVIDYEGPISAVNSTFTGNSSTVSAGGIATVNDLTLVYSTVTQNAVGVEVPLTCPLDTAAHAHPACDRGRRRRQHQRGKQPQRLRGHRRPAGRRQRQLQRRRVRLGGLQLLRRRHLWI